MISPINASLTLSESNNLTYINDTLIPRIGKSSDYVPDPQISKFSGNITNANGPLAVSISLDDSLDYSAITLNAETSLKPAHIQLDRRFEGNFAIEAKSASANVEDLSISGLYTEDRVRSIVYDERGNSSLKGWTGFSSEGRNHSHISLSNELGSALVTFTSPLDL